MPRLPGGRGMTALIRAEGLSVRLGGREVLHHVDLEIASGEIVTVVGPNGSGKTTLLRALIGAVPPSGGRIWRKPGLRIGYVPQKLAVDRTLPMTVRRFLDLPARVSDAAAAEALRAAGAEGLDDRQIADLSGGQFQRVMLARALLSKPELLMLDEAAAGLDQPGVADFYGALGTIRDRLGCAILLVSHELHVVMSASDRVICLNGHVCCAGTPEVVREAPEYRQLFGTGTRGTLALYRHQHDHAHDGHDHAHDHGGRGA